MCTASTTTTILHLPASMQDECEWWLLWYRAGDLEPRDLSRWPACWVMWLSHAIQQPMMPQSFIQQQQQQRHSAAVPLYFYRWHARYKLQRIVDNFDHRKGLSTLATKVAETETKSIRSSSPKTATIRRKRWQKVSICIHLSPETDTFCLRFRRLLSPVWTSL